MIRIFSVGIRSIPHLEALLGSTVGFGLAAETGQATVAVAGWGLRTSADKAIRYARQMKLPYLALEDGFLRSVGHGKQEPPLSIVIDDQGIYYDSGRPSRLESLIHQPLSSAQIHRAEAVQRLWCSGRVSKYNHMREWRKHSSLYTCAADVPTDYPIDARYVLVADQTAGDASITYGQADRNSFARMLDAALAENPGCTVLVKIHPDVWAGKKRGYINLEDVRKHPRVMVLDEDVHPAGLIEHAKAVYAVTSQVGFEGLLWGKPVRTFGMPFYAGWGLTQDELPAPERRMKVSLEQLIYAALIAYPRYINPETGRGCEVEEALEYLALQRTMRERFPRHIQAIGISAYKKSTVRRFFIGSAVHFNNKENPIPDDGALAVWGTGEQLSMDCPAVALKAGTRREVVHLEDGFLRSVGLGAELVRPVSWAMDRRGIYYDATRPSDLEHLLETTDFDKAMRLRARTLRARIVAEGVTKYNVGSGHWQRPSSTEHTDLAGNPTGAPRKVILVTGQVESDASLRYGASSIKTNVSLLEAVRRANPQAYIVYKPHPDVVCGLRAPGEDEKNARLWSDEIVQSVSVHELLGKVDEVHVNTSLTGFEALLRGKPVITYGQPFYAGWGLTQDLGLTHGVRQRRSRRLHIDELVAGVLILYPTYVSRTTGYFTTPERALDELLSCRGRGAYGSSIWRWLLRMVLRTVGPRR